MRLLWALPAILGLSACTGTPDSVSPVSPFELDRYLGEWHEVARLDHRFERGLTKVTAHYEIRDDGGVQVINRGYHEADDEWQEAEGRAYFVRDSNTGHLKVSFFGPFYGGYNIAKLDDDYTMALVVGHTLNYAWMLAREPDPKPAHCQQYHDYARELGVATDELIWLSDCYHEAQASQ